MICPSCDGRKTVGALVRLSAGGCEPRVMDCPRCKGTGAISEEESGWIALGNELRDLRLGLNLSQREMARRYGLSMAELSFNEFGRVDPQPLLDKLRAVKDAAS